MKRRPDCGPAAGPPFSTVLRGTFRTAWGLFIRVWKPMAWWTLLTWLLIGGILVPFSTGMLRRVVFRGDRLMVGHEELLAFLLTPAGLAYVLLAAGLTALGAVFRYAGLFHIHTAALKGEPVSVYQTLIKMLPDIPAQFRLCLKVAGIAVLLLVPLLGGILLVKAAWLAEHDINYYLYTRPPEWSYALVTAGLWALLWSATVLYLLFRSLPALPAYLDGYRPVWKAMARSWAMSRGRDRQLFGMILVALGSWGAIRFTVQAVLFSASAVLVEILINNLSMLTPVLMVTAVYGLLSFLAGLALSFVGFSFTASVLSTFYYQESGLHDEVAAVPLKLYRIPVRIFSAARIWLRPRRAIPVLVLLFLSGAVFSGWLLRLVPETRTFAVTAHRAGSYLGPENTLAALERAIAVGADYVEIDVQSTADGVVVVVHDADLMRVAGVPWQVSEVAYEEIAGLAQGTDDTIPDEERQIATLSQFLERARDRVKVNIELKYHGPDPQLAQRVVDLVRAHAMEDQVRVMSFDLNVVREMRRLAPELSTGYLTTVSVGDPVRLPVDFLAVPRQLATKSFVARAHRRGMEVHVWRINTASEMLSALQRGADNLITGAPDVAMQLRQELAALTPAERLLLLFRPRLDVLDLTGLDETETGEEVY